MAPRHIDEEVEALQGLADTQPLVWFYSLPVAQGARGTKQALDSQPLAGWMDGQMNAAGLCRESSDNGT